MVYTVRFQKYVHFLYLAICEQKVILYVKKCTVVTKKRGLIGVFILV